ncbi:Asp23/Gls24 family envelope stress response protein [Nocardiopsis sp. HNM0947]|uniref:Asp23/Gls24 family envelope stress response protein n=1 Tax=Nocardiopsis coralli TaxID=2772213 RepID=A0ABR9P221_9ACTN|nr:Asp23/Gls24 family envelope stress response protein [Nocardiopsis coralli]MBE2997888.1 Asp23/Gls24 family envelope stress response protein [Nocardiopsis coralli]
MSAASPEQTPVPLARGAPTAPAEERGTTSFPAKVVARVAEQAATEVHGVGSDAGGLLGFGARRDFGARPSVEADLYGATAVLRLNVGVAFPVAIAPVLEQLRAHVTHRVQHLTGLSVGRMDVEVSWLHAAGAGVRVLL